MSRFLCLLLAAAAPLLMAQTDGPGCAVNPASPSIGADVPASYFGPAPSTVNPSFVGPLQLLTAGELDIDDGTITMPLYRGSMRDGRSVWYILTDTTDEGNARGLGLNFSAKLTFGDTGRATRTATLQKGGVLMFDSGTVDFMPERTVRIGSAASPFPPSVATPGSVGDAAYSPLVKITNAGGHIYNAPMVAFNVTAAQLTFPNGQVDYRRVHDKVVSIDPVGMTVTLRLAPGFAFAKPVLYLSMDASADLAAALEESTWAPALNDIEVGGDDSAFSAVERIFVFVNGQRGCQNPHRQGLESALIDGRAPMNVIGGIPTVATDYSPLWDMNLGEWTVRAINSGFRARLIDEFQILAFVEQGHLTGPGGAPYGSVGIIINCPIVFRFL